MIKVLVATSKTQGARDNDYNWCIEQELVWFPPICRSSKVNGPDDSCGCGRGFGGLNSHRGVCPICPPASSLKFGVVRQATT